MCGGGGGRCVSCACLAREVNVIAIKVHKRKVALLQVIT